MGMYQQAICIAHRVETGADDRTMTSVSVPGLARHHGLSRTHLTGVHGEPSAGLDVDIITSE